jgi:hypothetical protein
VRLEGSAREERTHVIEQGVDISPCVTDRNGAVDRQDRVASRRLCAREGQSAGQLALGTTEAGERIRGLGGTLGQLGVILNGCRLAGTIVTHRVCGEIIPGVGLGIDGKSHKSSKCRFKATKVLVAH